MSITDDTSTYRSARVSRQARLMVACMASSVLADMLIWLRPASTAEYLHQRGLTNSTAGFIGTTELLVMATTLMLSSRYTGHIRYRTIALSGLVLAAAGTLGTIVVGGNVPLLLVTRLVAAFGLALLALVPTTLVARLSDAPSAYGQIFAVSMLCNAAALSMLPWLSSVLNRPPAFPALLLSAIVLAPIILLMPPEVRFGEGRQVDDASSPHAGARGRILLLAGGYSAVALAYHSVWTFFIVLAEKAGLRSQQADHLTALTALFAIIGSLASAPLARAIGLRRALSLITTFFLASMLTMIYGSLSTAFVVAACATIFLHFMMFPAVLGSAARVDSTGRGSAFVSASGWLVGATGAYVGGLVIDLAGYLALGVVTAVMLAAALVSFSAATGRSRAECAGDRE